MASAVLLILILYMIGVTSWKESAISDLGVLETLWLEAHSEILHGQMLKVHDPTLHNLRIAGVLDVCFADDIHEAQEKDDGRM